MPKIKFRDWHTRAALVLFDAVLLVVILNLVLYAILPPRHSKLQTPLDWYGRARIMKAYPGWQPDDVEVLLRETWRDQEYEPFTGFRQVPLRGKFLNIDPAGFRYSKDQAPWPPLPTATNVFVFGGSTTFGVGLPDGETIPSYLQEVAAANHPVPPVKVYNFAQPAYFSSQELIQFEQLLNSGFVPQTAVFIDGVNDFTFVTGQPLFADRFRNFMAGKSQPGALDYLPLVRAMRWLRQHSPTPKSTQPRVAREDDSPLLQETINRWLANKKMIDAIGHAYGVRTLFVWQPVPTYKYDLQYHFNVHSPRQLPSYIRLSGYGYPLMDKLYTQGKLDSNVLWLADMQEDKRENLYVDNVHYNAAFSKEIAERIYTFIRETEGETHSLAASKCKADGPNITSGQ